MELNICPLPKDGGLAPCALQDIFQKVFQVVQDTSDSVQHQ